MFEAETASTSEGVEVNTDKAGYSGSGYVDISDNTKFSLEVEIPASQYYRITVRHCAGSHKENPLLFNENKALDIVSENGDRAETTVDGVFLEKGVNTVTLGAGWSWFSLDSIAIENGSTISDAQGDDWYVGDEYCDIISTDIYNPAYDYSRSPALLSEMSTWTDGKLIAMSECATVTDPDLIVRDNAYWLWFAVWNWDYMVMGNTSILSEKYSTNDMLNKVYNSEVIITRDELPNFC